MAATALPTLIVAACPRRARLGPSGPFGARPLAGEATAAARIVDGRVLEPGVSTGRKLESRDDLSLDDLGASGPHVQERYDRPGLPARTIDVAPSAFSEAISSTTRAAKFPDGTKLFLMVDQPQPAIELDEDGEKAFDEAMAEVRQGKAIPLETFRAILHRL